ncbi:MAG: single-stranded-DNA-specific exonuclease RecJ [Gracilibacter sp. BRH_c7a]|nr:MAG: single-stranded-DNA-specific exonuclease RecJ [Gracilibacter sp. BRH_c7a]
MNNLWILSQKRQQEINNLQKLGFSPIMIDILFRRGYTSITSILEYLQPSLFELHSPFLFKDMEKVIQRLARAHKQKERILVYGDYDADGVTGTALLFKVFKKLGFNVVVHIPSREEGYGLHVEIIKKAIESKVTLIVTVDCGITAVKETELAASEGIDIIITDHHEPLEELPAAVGILNPKVNNSGYPYEYLAGVGVAYKLVQALFSHFRDSLADSTSELDYLDLVALGTIADIVPLTGENRIIVKFGLQKMERTSHDGLRALLEECGLWGKKLKAGQISFIVAPRINAAGRMDTAQMALNLLLEEDFEDAQSIAKDLSKENYLRQTVEKEIFNEIQKQLESDKLPKVIVLSSATWHHGVIGIVASRLVERYHRPVFLISEDGETAKGSARGIPGYNVIKELDQQAHLLDKYGGHKQAAGFSLSVKNIESLRTELNETMQTKNLLLSVEYNVDSTVSWNELNIELLKELELMSPFGAGNPAPMLMTSGLKICKIFTIGKEGDHLKLILEEKQKTLEALAFKRGHELEQLKNIHNLDIIYYLESNSFTGEERLQAIIKDYRDSIIDSSGEIACAGEENEEESNRQVNEKYAILSREILVDFYKRLKEMARDTDCFCWQPDENLEDSEISLLKVFEELGLITWVGGTGPFYLKVNKINKTDLNHSLRYRLLSRDID